MATLPGTYVRTALSTNIRINAIVDVFMSSTLAEFRQIMIYHERGTSVATTKVSFTYKNWNPDFQTQVHLNNSPTPLASGLYTVDNAMAVITIPTMQPNDNVYATYNFDYFPIYALEGFIAKSVDIINVAPTGAITDYTIDDAPSNWDGVISDLAFAMCMEKLILDYDLWKGRLIFAISPQAISDGSGGDIVSQLETLKRNAEERAFRAFDNPLFKAPHHLSKPTQYYYESLLVGASSRGQHGMSGFGKLRGFRLNKYLGRSLI